ncbi:MAG: family 2A encapsulin nanocompartment cargo protein cysteine desulfurase, partial [Leptothrix sp. (in: b-proteobacteria)]
FLDSAALSGGAPAAPSAPSGLDRLAAQPFALPGGEHLADRQLPATPKADKSPTLPATPKSSHYVLDLLNPNAPQAVPQVPVSGHAPFDVHAVRRDFPILRERVNGRPLVWFDNAATTQKPQAVIDRISSFYAHENSNIHRAAHALAARATDAYEEARETVRRFIGAGSTEEIIFVRGTTEAINLVAKSWGEQHIGAGDEIIVSHLEHHANIVPWQQLAARKGAKIRVIPVDDSGQVLLDEYQKLLNDRTKIVSVTQVSNALGTVVPVKEIVDIAKRHGVTTLVDGAQSVSHMRVDVRALNTDFFVFSGHKVFGPTGIGVLYGQRDVLEDMPPWQGGGNMIADVTFERTVFQPPPNKFEAGTGNIADAVGLGAALEYVERIGIEAIGQYEHDLLAYATQQMQPIPGVRLIGTARDKASVLSFVLAGHSTEEVGKALNQEGIAVRTGHHCAQPILRRFGLETTVRPSLAFYNTGEEVDRLVTVVKRLASARR